MAKAWELQREAFLSENEADRLLVLLATKTLQTSGQERDTALLDQLIVESLLLSGLRNSEFCCLTLGNAVRRGGSPAWVVERPGGSSRTVRLPNRVAGLVRQYVDEIRPGFLPEDIDPRDQSQPLVFGENRRPFERTGLYRRVVKILSEAGLGERASVQLLRHTYGYLAYLRTGGNLLFVQRQLGHAHPRITAVYAQFVEESYADLAERVAAVHEPREPPPIRRVLEPCRATFDCEID